MSQASILMASCLSWSSGSVQTPLTTSNPSGFALKMNIEEQAQCIIPCIFLGSKHLEFKYSLTLNIMCYTLVSNGGCVTNVAESLSLPQVFCHH